MARAKFTVSSSQVALESQENVDGEQATVVVTDDNVKGCWLSTWEMLLIAGMAAVLVTASGLVVGLTVPDCGEAPSPPPTKHDGWRTPDTVTPLHYAIELKPYLDPADMDPEDFYFTGNVNITVRCDKETNRIYLHTRRLEVSAIQVYSANDDTAAAVPEFVTSSYDAEREFLMVDLRSKLNVGATYYLYMEFTGKLVKDPNAMNGIYLSSYTSANGTEMWHMASQLESTSARRVFPCFDEPSFSPTYEAVIWRKKHHIALYNTPLLSSSASGEWMIDRFGVTLPMPTYLNAFVVCDFSMIETETMHGTQVRAFSQPGRIDQAQYSLQATKDILEFFEHHYRILYPMDKSDLVAVPDKGGAMENWGLVLYREGIMLYDTEKDSVSQHKSRATVIGHEIAHQWFGNLVTCHWWTHIWLNEGFASFLEWQGADKIEPEWKLWEQFVVDNLQSVMRLDSVPSARALVVPDDVINTPSEISSMFDSITYDKGGAVCRMMEYIMGTDSFNNGLTLFLERHSYGTATTSDLWDALQEQSLLDGSSADMLDGQHIQTIMNTWTLQNGYPVITVTRDYVNGGATVSQQRFLRDSSPTRHLTRNYNQSYELALEWVTADRDSWTSPERLWMHGDAEGE
ncbi:PREDICTED: aminopeptidase N-like [Priapulus caudatus]|uniref:Aminopeptidase N-like n=1 Tax=Priapulus caudatus TaxID=37621 RepID=A0ABM1DXV0_PRICU|nr:PREDICTED: aminopeptidase N-like [Priapulus caudatus]